MIMSPVDGVESSQYINSAEHLSFSILNLANQFELSKFREIEKISENIVKKVSKKIQTINYLRGIT